MSKSDEMFEELGYEKDICKNATEYSLNNEKEIDFVENVDTLEKEIWIDDFHVLSMQELQAINEKVKELGWNE